MKKSVVDKLCMLREELLAARTVEYELDRKTRAADTAAREAQTAHQIAHINVRQIEQKILELALRTDLADAAEAHLEAARAVRDAAVQKDLVGRKIARQMSADEAGALLRGIGFAFVPEET